MNKDEEKQYRELLNTDPMYKEAKMLESIEEVGIEKGIVIGREEGIEEGIEGGILIGKILMAQRILKQSEYSKEGLKGKTVDELRIILSKVEAKLN